MGTATETMTATVRPRLKVCCIASVEEARLAVRLGASALGLVGSMPSGPGVISASRAREIARAVPSPVMTVLLTSETDAEAIAAQANAAGVQAVQIVNRVEGDVLEALRDKLPGRPLWPVVHVTGAGSVPSVTLRACLEAERVAPFADAVLLDSGNPSAAVKELGGTGRVHDWSVSREIRERLSVPVLLAGGLRPDNAAAAVEAVGPFALDVCSGVRTDGALDAAKLAAFAESAGIR